MKNDLIILFLLGFGLSFASCKSDKSKDVSIYELKANGKSMLLENQDFSSKVFPENNDWYYEANIGEKINFNLSNSTKNQQVSWTLEDQQLDGSSSELIYQWDQPGLYSIGIQREGIEKVYAFVKIKDIVPEVGLSDHYNINKVKKDENKTLSKEYSTDDKTNNDHSPLDSEKGSTTNRPVTNIVTDTTIDSSVIPIRPDPQPDNNPPPPVPKPYKPIAVTFNNSAKVGYQYSDRCDESTRSFLDFGPFEVVLRPKQDLELIYVKMISSTSGKVNVTIECDELNESIELKGRSLIGNAPTEVNFQSKDVTLMSGKSYRLSIMPIGDISLENFQDCGSISVPSSDVLDVVYDDFGAPIFDIKIKF